MEIMAFPIFLVLVTVGLPIRGFYFLSKRIHSFFKKPEPVVVLEIKVPVVP